MKVIQRILKLSSILYLFFVSGIMYSLPAVSMTESNVDFDCLPSLIPFADLTADFESSACTMPAEHSQMSADEMFELSMILSGVDVSSEKGHDILSCFDTLKSLVRSPEVFCLEEIERGEKILSVLYDNLLTQYVKTHSTIDMAFEDGSYDCVSSSILYVCLAKASGLCVRAQNVPGHTYVSLYSGTEKIDIETTTPDGFNPGSESRISYSGVNEISDYVLLSLISKNLNSYYMEKNDYFRAVPQAVMRLYFLQEFCFADCNADGSSSVIECRGAGIDARADFDTTVSNYAEILKRNNPGILALDWLDRVSARWGSSARLLRTYNDIVCNAAVYYSNIKDFDSAAYVLDKYGSESIPFAQAKTIFTNKLESDVKNSDFEKALECIEYAEQKPLAKNPDIAEQILSLKEYLWSSKIDSLADSGEYLEAALMSDIAVMRIPSSRLMKKLSDSSWRLYDADVHNEYARILNGGEKTAAMHVLQDGLKNHPDSEILSHDLQSILGRFDDGSVCNTDCE